MKQWMKQAVVCAPIERIWTLANGSAEQIQKLIPGSLDLYPKDIESKDVDGVIYLYKYKDGNRIGESEVQVLDYANRSVYKGVKISFETKKTFETTVCFQLYRVNDELTNVRITITKVGRNWWAKLVLPFETGKFLHDLMDRIKRAYEHEDLSDRVEVEVKVKNTLMRG